MPSSATTKKATRRCPNSGPKASACLESRTRVAPSATSTSWTTRARTSLYVNDSSADPPVTTAGLGDFIDGAEAPEVIADRPTWAKPA